MNVSQVICEWYDGYRFGNTDIFNPWSVIGYFNSGCEAKAFWVSTSSNDIIGEILQASTSEIQERIFQLLSGRTVFTRIDTDVIYPEMKGNPASVYSFLLVAGYLKIVRCEREATGEYMYEVAIPNKEISAVYFAGLPVEDVEGIYMRDIIREEMKADDARLQ